MTKDIRRLGKMETEAMFKLACYAFNKEPSVERREHFARLADHSWNYGLFIEDKLASQVMCTPFQVNFHGTRYKMGGIGYVSSYPEFRGQGGIKETMRQIIADMQKNNLALSYLAPFSYGFYRQFGYEQVFENLNYELSSHSLPKSIKAPGFVKRMKLKEVTPYLKELYEKDAHNKRGGLLREDWWWHYILSKNKERNYAVYFNEEKQAEGYVVYERHLDTFKVVEWNYLTPNAFHGLGRFILSHDSAFAKFICEMPNSEHSLSYLLDEPYAKVTVIPYMMARIVDLILFLEKYPFLRGAKDQVFLLGVKDDYAPWNEGVFELKVTKDGQSEVRKLSQDVSDPKYKAHLLVGQIQEWTQLFMGYRRPKDLAFYGRLQGNIDLFNHLEEVIPRGLPTLPDYF